MQHRLLALIMILAMVLVACETNDDAGDTLSAQNQQPALVGYQTTDLDIASDALLAAAGGTAVTSGNVPGSLGVYLGKCPVDRCIAGIIWSCKYSVYILGGDRFLNNIILW